MVIWIWENFCQRSFDLDVHFKWKFRLENDLSTDNQTLKQPFIIKSTLKPIAAQVGRYLTELDLLDVAR